MFKECSMNLSEQQIQKDCHQLHLHEYTFQALNLLVQIFLLFLQSTIDFRFQSMWTLRLSGMNFLSYN